MKKQYDPKDAEKLTEYVSILKQKKVTKTEICLLFKFFMKGEKINLSILVKLCNGDLKSYKKKSIANLVSQIYEYPLYHKLINDFYNEQVIKEKEMILATRIFDPEFLFNPRLVGNWVNTKNNMPRKIKLQFTSSGFCNIEISYFELRDNKEVFVSSAEYNALSMICFSNGLIFWTVYFEFFTLYCCFDKESFKITFAGLDHFDNEIISFTDNFTQQKTS